MPGGDGTGPKGKGPKTGRGLGKSVGNESGQNVGHPRQKHTHDHGIGNGLGNRKKMKSLKYKEMNYAKR